MGESEALEPLVLHVIPTTAPRGAQREARALADRLDTPGTRRHRVLSLVGTVPSLEGEVAADYTLDGGGTSATTVGFDPRLVIRLRRALDRLAPALVVAHGGEPLKFLVPAMIGRRRPLAYYAIGTLAPPGHRPGRKFLWRYLARRPDLVAAEGAEVLDECRDLLGVPPARLVLVPNGRDPEEFHPGSDAANRRIPVVSFVGAFTHQKRPDRFVEVVAALRARGLDFHALAVGDGPLSGSLSAAAAVAGVDLLGARGDVAEVLQGTDILVFPSLPLGEGMPGVLIEAGLSAVPVVATSVPGVDAIVADGETGLVVGVDDFDALVEATADADRRSRPPPDHGTRRPPPVRGALQHGRGRPGLEGGSGSDVGHAVSACCHVTIAVGTSTVGITERWPSRPCRRASAFGDDASTAQVLAHSPRRTRRVGARQREDVGRGPRGEEGARPVPRPFPRRRRRRLWAALGVGFRRVSGRAPGCGSETVSFARPRRGSERRP